MICADTPLTDWLNIIRGEFLEMPGLHLTRSQFQRLWALDARTCDETIDALVKSRFLVRKADGNYARYQSVA
jgi:putative heme degradation protein